MRQGNEAGNEPLQNEWFEVLDMTNNERRIHYGWIVVFAAALATIGAQGFGRMAYTLILPSMKEGLALSYTQAGLLSTGNFIGYLVFSLIAGFLASRYNSRYIISMSLALVGFTMILTGLARSFEWAFVMRLLTGLGSGGANVPAMALGSVWFAMRYRGLATGIALSGVGVGATVGAVLLPQILPLQLGSAAGWRLAWFVLGGLVLVISLVCFALVRARPDEVGCSPVGGEHLTAGGAKKSMTSDVEPSTPADGCSRERAKSRNTEANGDSGGSSLRWSLVYGKGVVWHLGTVYFAYGFSYVIYMTFFAAYLKNEIGWTNSQTGLLWAVVGFLSIFCGVLWGSVSDRIGRKYGIALVYLVLAASYLLFAAPRMAVTLYLSAVLFGLCAWSIASIMAAASGDYVGRHLASACLGFVTLFFGVGQALGSAVGGYIADVSGSFVWAFVLAALVSLMGFAGAILLPPPAGLPARTSAAHGR